MSLADANKMPLGSPYDAIDADAGACACMNSTLLFPSDFKQARE